MKELIDSVRVEGTTLRVSAVAPLPVDHATLAVAAAIRSFERYPVMRRFSLRSGDAEVSLSRDEVERLLQPEGFARLKEGARWRQVLARAVQAYLGEGPA